MFCCVDVSVRKGRMSVDWCGWEHMVGQGKSGGSWWSGRVWQGEGRAAWGTGSGVRLQAVIKGCTSKT